MRAWVAAGALIVGGCAGSGQGGAPEQELSSHWEVLDARFTRASGVSSDGLGTLWVADEGGGRLLRLEVGSNELESIGTRGLDAGEFDAPADVDASFGLLVAVADEGSRTVQVFSRTGRFLERLVLVPHEDDVGIAAAYLEGESGDAPGAAAPSGVAWAADERLAVLAAEARQLFVVDRDRTRIRSFSLTAGARPSAVALFEGGFVVAYEDAARLTILRGGEQQETRLNAPVRAMSLAGGALWLAGPTGLRRYHPDLGDVACDLPLPESLVDLAVVDAHVYILTARSIAKAPLACGR